MARRGSNSSRNDDGMGCLMLMFELPLLIVMLLFSSGNPAAKKVAWGIIGFILAFLALGSMGASPGVAIGIIVVVVVIIIAVMVTSDSSKINSGNPSSFTDNYSDKSSDVILPNSREQQQPTIAKTKDFNTQLAIMKEQVKNVTGEQVGNASERAIYRTEKAYIYASDIASVCSKYDVPETAKKVLITSSKISDVNECPALIWTKNERFCILALLRVPIFKEYTGSIPAIVFTRIEYEHQRVSFELLKKEPISAEFSELLEENKDSKRSEGIEGVFSLTNGIELTSTSGKNLFRVLPDSMFFVVDGITQSGWYPEELKELYKQHILLVTGVLAKDEYDEKRNVAVSQYIQKEKDEERAKQHLKEFKELGLIDDELYLEYLNKIIK